MNQTTTINIFEKAGSFAENKDIAKKLRTECVLPTLDKGGSLLINFEKVDGATQSFIHALISESIRQYGPQALEKITFSNCSDSVKKIITIVADYMQVSD